MKGLTMFLFAVSLPVHLSVFSRLSFSIPTAISGGSGILLRVGGSRKLMTGEVRVITQNVCTSGRCETCGEEKFKSVSSQNLTVYGGESIDYLFGFTGKVSYT